MSSVTFKSITQSAVISLNSPDVATPAQTPGADTTTSSFASERFAKSEENGEFLNQNAPLTSLKDRVTAATPSNTANATEAPTTTQPVCTYSFTAYHNAFEYLRRHLHGLSNPYLVEIICKKLWEFTCQDIFMSDKKQMFFEDSLPSETIAYFRAFFSELDNRIWRRDQKIQKIILEATSDLIELNKRLLEQNSKKLIDFKGWTLCERLFNSPSFLRLKDSEFKKFMQLVELESPHQLREYVDQLDQTMALDKRELEKFVKENSKYRLSTFLGQLIKTKPEKKTGILTYWNHHKEFFINKKLQVESPGNFHIGLIVGCEIEAFSKCSSPNSIKFQLQDKTEIQVQKSETHKLFCVSLIKTYSYKLWASISTGIYKAGDKFYIKTTPDSFEQGIQPGLYELSIPNDSNQKRWVVSNRHHMAVFDEETSQKNQIDLIDLHDGHHTSTSKYRLEVHYANNNPYEIEIKHWSFPENQYVTEKKLSIQAFESMHRVIKKESFPLSITQDEADDKILILDEPNEERMRLHNLEKIKLQFDDLLRRLARKPSLMDLLLNNLAEKKLISIDFDCLNKSDSELANAFKNLSKKYYDDLKAERSPEELLKQAVLEVNYSELITKENNILIARTMELLSNAHEHVERIKNHDLILFMGNTGSGKSTSISFLMGANLEEFSNQVGEKALKIGDETDSTTLYPKIGQSLGSSETIYAQGYQAPEADCMLGDCPGFSDTRGGDYELCTNFSIDEAVRASKNIRAIVIVLPAAAFLIDKGNSVIDLIETVKGRFSGICDPVSVNNRLFLLITKENQIQAEIVKNLKNGTRFSELVHEAQKGVQELEDKKCDPDSFEVRSTMCRFNIWTAILQLHRSNQIDFIDTEDDQQREDLLKKYAENETITSPFLNKRLYLNSMDSKKMKKNFGDCVQMSAHSWSHHLFGQYLKAVPMEIRAAEHEFARKKDYLQETENEKEDRLAQLKSVREKIITLEERIKRLNAIQDKPADKDLSFELLQAGRWATERLNEEIKRLEDFESKLSGMRSKRKKLKSEIGTKSKEIDDKTKEISELKKQIERLRTGDKEEKLFERRLNPEGFTEGLAWKSKEDINNAVSELCIKENEYFEKSTKIQWRDYKGKAAGVVLLEKDYKLVPTRPELRKQFFETYQADGYMAKIDGLHYNIWRGIAQADGKKIGYSFELEFLGNDDLPWISITHTIPNSEYNSAAITNLESQIGLCQKEISNRSADLRGPTSGMEQEKEDLDKEILSLKNDIEGQKMIIENLKGQAKKQIADFLNLEQNELDKLQQTKTELENNSHLDNKISSIKSELDSQKEIFVNLKKKLRNLAIIITTQWESARHLREFANFVIRTRTSSSCDTDDERYANNGAIYSCKEFIELYDANKSLVDQIKEIYEF